MSENHVTEQVSEADSDSGSQIGHDYASNGVTESTTGTYQEDASVAINQVNCQLPVPLKNWVGVKF